MVDQVLQVDQDWKTKTENAQRRGNCISIDATVGGVLKGQNSIIEDNESAGDKNRMMVLFARRQWNAANSGSKTSTGVSIAQNYNSKSSQTRSMLDLSSRLRKPWETK